MLKLLLSAVAVISLIGCSNPIGTSNDNKVTIHVSMRSNSTDTILSDAAISCEGVVIEYINPGESLSITVRNNYKLTATYNIAILEYLPEPTMVTYYDTVTWIAKADSTWRF